MTPDPRPLVVRGHQSDGDITTGERLSGPDQEMLAHDRRILRAQGGKAPTSVNELKVHRTSELYAQRFYCGKIK